MANTIPTFAAGTISHVQGNQQRPVFFIKLNGSPALNYVVKGEAAPHGLPRTDLESSIRWSAKIMKNVQHSAVNVKLMTNAEIAEFQRAVGRVYGAGSIQLTNATRLDRRWVKMPFVPGLSEGDMYDTATRSHPPAEIARVLAHLLDAAAWKELGKIAAVDLFNGNSDRLGLVLNPDSTYSVAWTNQGNFFFVNAPGAAVPMIGLDTFDPAMANDPSNLGSGQLDAKSFQILDSDDERDWFCTAAVEAVAEKFARLMERAHLDVITVRIPLDDGTGGFMAFPVRRTRLTAQLMVYRNDFRDGMVEAIGRLKTYLDRKRTAYAGHNRGLAFRTAHGGLGGHRGGGAALVPKHIPAGVQNRMTRLGI